MVEGRCLAKIVPIQQFFADCEAPMVLLYFEQNIQQFDSSFKVYHFVFTSVVTKAIWQQSQN